VDQHLIELLLLCDAARRAGADRVTTVVPYFGYARQDRRAQGREALTARLAADAIATAGAGRVVAVDVHGPCIEGFFSLPFEHLTARKLLLAELRRAHLPENSVVVSPDLGAVKLAEFYANWTSPWLWCARLGFRGQPSRYRASRATFGAACPSSWTI
jgi:ribose-phosphate pyrophosphokinase